MKINSEYKQIALSSLQGNWTPAVLATLVYFLIAAVLSAPSSLSQIGDVMPTPGEFFGQFGGSLLLSIFVMMPLELGFYLSFLRLQYGDNNLSSNMFQIATTNYLHKVWGLFLMGLYLVLWYILLFVPGLIKSFSYAMTPFILEERPELSANEAIDLSRAMMKGRKFDLFYLFLSFIGWVILACFTLGIGFFWLMPYMYSAYAAFYIDVRDDYYSSHPEIAR